MKRLAVLVLAIGGLAVLTACNAGQPGQSGQEPASSGELAIDDTERDAGATRVGDEDALLSQAERLQANLDAILASSSQVTGSWFVGDVTADFTMYFAGDKATYADERVKRGDGGTAWRQYYFEAGTLVFYVEEGERPSASGAMDSVVVVLDFDPRGEVEAFYKSIGGQRADLGESEEAQVLQNLERLREGARQAGP